MDIAGKAERMSGLIKVLPTSISCPRERFQGKKSRPVQQTPFLPYLKKLSKPLSIYHPDQSAAVNLGARSLHQQKQHDSRRELITGFQQYNIFN